MEVSKLIKCKWCQSSTHKRKTHNNCPYNPKNILKGKFYKINY